MAAATFGHERRWLPICITLLCFFADSTSISPSLGLWLHGFSKYTCLPAAQANKLAGACQWSGAVTISTSKSLSSKALRKSGVFLGDCFCIFETSSMHILDALLSTSQICRTSQLVWEAKFLATANPRLFTPIPATKIFSLAPTILE